MKLGILLRGPIRPNSEIAINNIKLLTDCFIDHTVTTVLFSWDTPNSRKVHCDVNVLEKEPTNEFIFSKVNHNIQNSFKQYYVMKRATEFVSEYDDFDYVIQSRTDMKIIIDKEELDNWFDDEHYVVHYYYGHRASYICDQFGIANPDVMRKAFNYHDFKTLDEMTSQSDCPDQILDKIIVKNNVKLKLANLKLWALEEDRHKEVVDESQKGKLIEFTPEQITHCDFRNTEE